MKQTSFLKQLGYSSSAEHGGDKSFCRRKKRRPLDPRFPVHLVMRSSRAKGALSLRYKNNLFVIHRLLHEKARYFAVQVESYANVGNHLHLKVRFSRREQFQNFLRTIAALIARLVTGARRGHAKEKFWDRLAYTKVVRVWTQEEHLDRYLRANRAEGNFGAIARARVLREELKFNRGKSG